MKLLKLSFLVMITAVLFMSCQKEYSLENSRDLIPAGTWQFNDSTKFFTGNMDTAYIITTGSTKILHLEGTSLTGGQKFRLLIYGDTVLKTGTYLASAGDVEFLYFTPLTSIYQAGQLSGEFKVNINVLSNNTVAGTFFGLADDSLIRTKSITLGSFTSKIDLSTNVIGGGGGNATGTLGNTAGNCAPTTFAGTYTQGVPLNASNTAQVQVTVATLGAYTISTNTVNGVSFSKTGTFTSTGSQNVILGGTGTSTVSGAQTFTVTFGTSTCNFPITFAAAGPPAAGTLGGGPGMCTPVTPAGTFTQGVALGASNTITIQANVTTVGSYNITTSTVNGVMFSGSGNFAATGTQNVVLTGSGTPTNAGAQNFIITFGTSTCNFSITFLAAPTGDYFPLTLNSNWTYDESDFTGFLDSILRKVISYSPTFATRNYNTISTNVTGSTSVRDSAYYRKPGGDYYQYGDLADYFGFDNPVPGEFIFLKDNVAIGNTWQSPNFTGSISGLPITGFIKMTLVDKTSAIIGSNSFPNVIKVKYEFYYTIASGTPIATANQWFAKGVGLIHLDDDSGYKLDITHYQVF